MHRSWQPLGEELRDSRLAGAHDAGEDDHRPLREGLSHEARSGGGEDGALGEGDGQAAGRRDRVMEGAQRIGVR